MYTSNLTGITGITLAVREAESLVGWWGHKEYVQYPIGILGMSFLHKLGGQSELGNQLSNFHRN